MAKDDEQLQPLERAIAGALRSQIKDHGPITPEWIGSAVKRIMGQLKNANASGLASALAQKRWRATSPDERRAIAAEVASSRWDGVSKTAHAKVASSGGKKAWAGKTAEEISEIMKERARVRAANKRKAGDAG